jgi:hypothetical protein
LFVESPGISASMSAWIGPAIVAALIGCLTTMLGWTVSYRQLRNLESVKRREKIVDYQTALRAEIRSYRARLSQVDLQALRHGVVERMREDVSYTPFIPLEAPHHIFPEIARDIHILPTEVIDPVVVFYSQTSAIAQLTADLRSNAYGKLATERKIKLYEDYVGLLVHAVTLSEQALGRLDERLSNLASDRSVR